MLSPGCPKGFQKPPGNFSETFLSNDKLVPTEIIGRLHLQKIQFYGCKHGLYFIKSRKVPLGKLPPEKNPPENISDKFVKFRKFFPPGHISENFGENLRKFYG
jgi:hypothetical protein